MSLGGKTSTAVIWSGLDRILTQLLQFAISIVVARMLSPDDYGIIAITSVFISLSQVFIDSGFSEALIQNKSSTTKDFCTVFHFSFFIGFIIYLALFTSAPLIEEFYNINNLTLYVRIICINILINSLCVVYKAKILIQLDFRRNTKISLLAVIISGAIAICVAYNGYGVWALICQSLISNMIVLVGLLSLIKWKPELMFSRESFSRLFSYGSKLLFANVLHNIYLSLYTLCVGKLYSSKDLGNYNRASTFAQFPSTNVSSIVDRAMFPIICKIQDDENACEIMFLKVAGFLTYTVLPFMISLAFLSRPIILNLLGSHWIDSIPLLQLLCVAYMFSPLMRLMNNTINARGRSDLSLKAEYFKKTFSIIILIFTVRHGLKIMCFGLILYELLDFIVMYNYIKKIMPQLSLSKLFMYVHRVLLLNLILCLSLLLVNELFVLNIFSLILCSLMMVIIYITLSEIFRINEWQYIKSLIIRKRT